MSISTKHNPPSVVLGSFELRERLGEGSYASAYLAKQQGMERVAVVKIAHPHLIEGPHESFIRARFKVEIQAAARVTHPNLAVIYTSGEVEGLPALAMEYVQGPTLERWLAQRGRLNEALCARVFGQLADVLAALHREGIVHRDVSPANIIIERADSAAPQPKLLDFGVARMDNTPNATAGPIGTPYYMAPEQLFGESSPACDVFSLGSLMWLALTGELLLSGETTSEVLRALHALDGTADPRQRLPRITPQMAELVRAMLQPEPGKRPSAEHICTTLRTLMHDELDEHGFAAHAARSGAFRALSHSRVTGRPIQQTPTASWSSHNTGQTLQVKLYEGPDAQATAQAERALPLHSRLTRAPAPVAPPTLDDLEHHHAILLPLLNDRALTHQWLQRARAIIGLAGLSTRVYLYTHCATLRHVWYEAGVDEIWSLPQQLDELRQAMRHTHGSLPALNPMEAASLAEDSHIFQELIEQFIGAMPEWLLELEEAVEEAQRPVVLSLCEQISSHAMELGAHEIVARCRELSSLPSAQYPQYGRALAGALINDFRLIFQELASIRSR